MTSETPRATARDRRRTTTEIKRALRELSVHLALLNRQVGGRLRLREIDLDCLDIINAHGPLTPTALARRAGLHPATTTGLLDRLESAGWISRDRDPTDRRVVQVRALRDRNAELLALFAGMNTSVDEICGDYADTELERLADFLNRTADAGRKAADDLVDG